jgi:hypothetical protein
MDSIRQWSPTLTEKIWSEEEKQEWLAAHGQEATHLVVFEPVYQLELCIPPWEDPDRHIVRSAQAWGRVMGLVFEEAPFGSATVLAARHEGNAIEVCAMTTARPQLHLVV